MYGTLRGEPVTEGTGEAGTMTHGTDWLLIRGVRNGKSLTSDVAHAAPGTCDVGNGEGRDQ